MSLRIVSSTLLCAVMDGHQRATAILSFVLGIWELEGQDGGEGSEHRVWADRVQPAHKPHFCDIHWTGTEAFGGGVSPLVMFAPRSLVVGGRERRLKGWNMCERRGGDGLMMMIFRGLKSSIVFFLEEEWIRFSRSFLQCFWISLCVVSRMPSLCLAQVHPFACLSPVFFLVQ